MSCYLEIRSLSKLILLTYYTSLHNPKTRNQVTTILNSPFHFKLVKTNLIDSRYLVCVNVGTLKPENLEVFGNLRYITRSSKTILSLGNV